jgi:hypothetical protein
MIVNRLRRNGSYYQIMDNMVEEPTFKSHELARLYN